MKGKTTELSFLLLALFLIIFLHSYYFSELYYDHDIPGCVYNTLDVMKGKGWYYSIWQPKPPGINLIQLSAFNIFGKSFKSIYIAALIFNIFSAFFLYLFAKLILSKEIKLFYLLPVLYALFCVSVPLQGHSANNETFLAAFEIASILFLALGSYFISGLLLGMGFIVKQHILPVFLTSLIYIMIVKVWDKQPVRIMIKNLFYFISAFILPLLLSSVYFLRLGVFDKFINYTFIYNLRHLSQYLKDIRQIYLPLTKGVLWKGLNFEIALFGLLSLLGILFTIRRPNKSKILITLWFVIVWGALFLKIGIYRHHFIQGIASLVCISLIGISGVYDTLISKRRRSALIAFYIILFVPYLRLIMPIATKKAAPVFWYGAKDRFLTSQYIKERTSKQDKIFIWDGMSTGAIVLWSERDNITHFAEKYSFLPQELRRYYWMPSIKDYKLNQQSLISSLNKEMPAYIIVSVVNDNNSTYEQEMKAFPEFFIDILKKHYYLETAMGICLVYRREKVNGS